MRLFRLRALGVLSSAFLLTSCAGALPGVDRAIFGEPQAQPGPQNIKSRIAFGRKEARDSPKTVEPFLELGRAYLSQGDFVRAAASYHEALLLHPDQSNALIGMSQSLSGQGRFQEAYSYAEKVPFKMSNIKTLNAIGISLAGQGNCPAAISYFEKILTLMPRDIDARTNIALCYAFDGDRRGYTIMRAAAYAPDARKHHIHNLYLVGWLLGMSEDVQQDIKHFGSSKDDVRQVFEEARNIHMQRKWTAGVSLDPYDFI